MDTNLIVAGVGGQGSILVSHVIAEAAIRADNDANVRVGETFGAAMRGGAVASHVRVGKIYGPLVGRGQADLILAMEPLEGLRVGVEYLAPGGIAILNTEPVQPVDAKIGAVNYPVLPEIVDSLAMLGKAVVTIDAGKLAMDAGSDKTLSVDMLGAAFASKVLPFAEEDVLEALKERLPTKILDINLKAFALGKQAYLAATSGVAQTKS